MPFKSKAQRRKFAALLMKGEISPETFEEWNRATGTARLPERVTPAKKKPQSRLGAPRSKARTKGASKRSTRRRSR